jgi:hypothetical protein
MVYKKEKILTLTTIAANRSGYFLMLYTHHHIGVLATNIEYIPPIWDWWAKN